MKKILHHLAMIGLLIAPLGLFAQKAELVINGTSEVTVVEHGGSSSTPIYIVVDNGNATSVANPGIPTPTGTNGFIVSENEYDKLKWDVASSTSGTYTVPFGDIGATHLYYLPLSVSISATASATAYMNFSTWHTQPDDWTGTTSLTGKASDVANMHSMYATGYAPSLTDNSYNVVSRFWRIIPKNFTALSYPSPGISFTYISNSDSSEISDPAIPSPGPKSITQANLVAQRFDTATSTWGNWLGTGTVTTGANTSLVTSGAVTTANIFNSWTLSNSIDPLPIVLGNFSAQCNNGVALVQWTSESEINNDHYTVLKTTDNIHFETVGEVKGAGNSSLPINYSIIDNSPYSGTSYYVLEQTDFDGNTSAPLSTYEFNGCDGATAPVSTIKAYNTTSYIEIQINSVADENYDILLTNMLGQTIIQENHSTVLGSNEIHLNNDVSPGIYLLSIRNDKTNYTKKLVLGVR